MPYTLHADPRSSHQQIAAIVRGLGRGPVLDVGAAQGFLGQLLRPAGIVVDAIEPDAARAAEARPHYRTVFASTVESAHLPAREYAAIVCADVLEHIVDPVAMLRALRGAAAPDAVFVVSLPNVAHIMARAALLTGRFPQMDRGIFDRTHLHFYTRHTATAMLRDAGLDVVDVRTTPVPLEVVWPRRGALVRLAMAAQDVAGRIAPTLFAFQWIFIARARGTRPAA